jgi:hypothetical protein
MGVVMKSVRSSVGYLFACFGLWVAAVGCFLGGYDTLQWLRGTAWLSTSFQSVFGTPPSNSAAWLVGLWVQPLWLLAMLGGAFLSLLGAAIIDRRGSASPPV